MNLRFNLTIGALFILAGLLLGSSYIRDIARSQEAYATVARTAGSVLQHSSTPAVALPTNTAAPRDEPTQISIPSVDINIGVNQGTYDTSTNTWSISADKAYFATVTSTPNTEEGNTFIYGHDRAGVFRNLKDIQPGALAEVTTSSGQTFIYSFSSKLTTDPSDVSIFNYHGAPILTLQTCTGTWSQHRSQFTFKLIGVR